MNAPLRHRPKQYPGFLVDIEGLDGSGKRTQSLALRKALEEQGIKTSLYSFPQYETEYGRKVKAYLNGELRMNSVENIAALYALDRAAVRDLIKRDLEQGYVVICDRYTPSNLAFQTARCSKDKQAEFFGWCEQFEYDVIGLPRPDMVIFLDIPKEITQGLVDQKGERGYTDKKRDLHEADTSLQGRATDIMRLMSRIDPIWRPIDCTNSEGGLHTIDYIQALVFSKVSSLEFSELNYS